MALYGSIEQVKRMLRPSETTTFGADVDARLLALRAAVSATIEEELGRSFGEIQAETTQVCWGSGSPTLVFERPMATITAVTIGASRTTQGAWTGGAHLARALWTTWPEDAETGTAYGLRRLDGNVWGASDAWGNPSSVVLVTGRLAATDADASVPDEIAYAANHLIHELFKRENASPAGYIGPDGTVTPMRDPYADPEIRRIFDKWRARRRALAV